MPATMQPLEDRETGEARPTRERLLGLFRETASEVVEKDFNHATEPTAISEMAIDSLGLLEIIGSLERRLRIQIPDDSLSGIETIGDLLDEVEKRLA
jgi:acyl carrier protein